MKFIVAATFLTVLVTSSNGQEWIPWKASQGVPKHAVPGGYEGALSLYVVRAPVGDEIAPGKYVTNHDQAYIPFWGEEKQVKEFEVSLVKYFSNFILKVNLFSFSWLRMLSGSQQQTE